MVGCLDILQGCFQCPSPSVRARKRAENVSAKAAGDGVGLANLVFSGVVLSRGATFGSLFN